ncbi:hypothetical protein RYX36_008275 [Vicia faba]
MMRVDERRGSGHAMGEDLIGYPSPYYFLLNFSFLHFEILLYIWFRRGVSIAVASLFSSLSKQPAIKPKQTNNYFSPICFLLFSSVIPNLDHCGIKLEPSYF